MDELQHEYGRLLSQLEFNHDSLDYSVFTGQLPMLRMLSQVNNSGITVFDLAKREHIYTSYNFSELFGYDLDAIKDGGNEYFNSRVHPDDLVQLYKSGIDTIRYYLSIPTEERCDYKFVNQYRVLGKEGKWVRVIEQHQALELDSRGNVWLALGVIDISPDQTNHDREVQSQIYNFKTGNIIPWPVKAEHETTTGLSNENTLSKREVEILKYIREGMLSKEISNKLFISVNTVNTHRQRILKKLGANNSHEATVFATKLGLL